MRITKDYKLRVQFTIFLLSLLTILFVFLGIFIFQYAQRSIFTRNSLRMQGQLSDFVDMFDIQNTLKTKKVKEDLKIAHHVFYEATNEIKEIAGNKMAFKAVNQQSFDTFDIEVPIWHRAGERVQQNRKIVDQIQSLGPKTATIFQKIEYGYLRISTNVKNLDGSRATGTFIPNGSPVVEAIERGETYRGRAYVVNDWYIVSSEPIFINGKIGGMLVVGEKEKDLTLIKEKFYHKKILETGHPFILSNNEDYTGLMVVDKYAEGENWFATTDLKKRTYFDNLINAYVRKQTLGDVQMEAGSEVFSFETPSPVSDRKLIVFFQYYNTYEYFIGVVIPKDDFITLPLIKLFIIILSVIVAFLLISIFFVSRFVRSITRPLEVSLESVKQMTQGELPNLIPVEGHDEIAELGHSLNTLSTIFNKNASFAREVGQGKFEEDYQILSDSDVLGNALVLMRSNLKELSGQQERVSWLQTSTNKVNLFLREEKELSTLSNELLSLLAEILDFQVAALYYNSDEKYKLIGSYAFNVRKTNANEFAPGEGLVGQAVLERKTIIFKNAPKDFIFIQSGIGEIEATNVVVVPLIYQEKVRAVLEIGTAHDLKDEGMELLEKVSESVAIAIHSIKVRKEMKELLNNSIEQQKVAERAAAELAASEEELKQSNEMLEAQARSLKDSEGNLQAQQEELRVINEELHEKGRYLEIQKAETETKNKELELAGQELERKARELESSSQYKSEFLANMSHELRTPLNSLLILSDDLARNKKGNLDEDQVESAEIIYKSGQDLLNLINDILDLSKIESGKMQLVFEQMPLSEIEQKVMMNFKRITESKNIYVKVNRHEGVPGIIVSDVQRVYQIIKNLVSNAVKFTSKGGVAVDIRKPEKSEISQGSVLNQENSIAIAVTDTGIGIPLEKQQAIFDAFRQADGGTSRKFGGTGLGLSISRELAKLLSGEIHLRSIEGEGSCFTLILPISNPKDQPEDLKKGPVSGSVKDHEDVPVHPPSVLPLARVNYSDISDDREGIEPNKRTILVVEDDTVFLNTLLKMCHEKGFNFLAANSGTEGLIIANKFHPDAIVLDISLPDANGWDILKTLKETHGTRHIPVHMMSSQEQSIDAVERGAIGFILKPTQSNLMSEMIDKIEDYFESPDMNLLIVEDDQNLRTSIKKLISKKNITTSDASSGNEAISILQSSKVDCMVLDLGLPDISGFELLERLKNDKHIKLPPIVVYTGKDLSVEENEMLHQYTNAVIIKGEKSEERLLDETALFLHKLLNDTKNEKPGINGEDYENDKVFAHKTILLVDDDMRNVFALGKILRDNGMEVIKAANGKMALEKLGKHPEIDFVLLDIMMPEMDGYETLTQIRAQKGYKNLPVIALTAKAMKGDKEKCLAAGASDYLMKPVDVDKLLSLMRVWLYN